MKTPRQFKNAVYQYLVSNDVTDDTASRISSEAELWASAFQSWELRDINTAMMIVGFKPPKENEDEINI